MTRLLADLLGVRGPAFHLGLQQLEQSAGRPSHDVRLSSAISQTMLTKLRSLGLDEHDTTGPELYAALGDHLQADEIRFEAALRGTSPDGEDPIAHIAKVIERELDGQSCFVLKNSVAKKFLKTNIPKKTMKLLGYRSADSMLKHETAASLYAAAWLVENDQWTRRIIGSYAKLKPTDFEVRRISVEHPTSKRWQNLSETIVAQKKHNVLSFKELGVVVLLPLPAKQPKLIALTTTVLALHAVNAIQASSTFLKLHQVQSNFGVTVQNVITGEPSLSTRLLDQPVSWHMVQQYYSRLHESMRANLFEPVVHAEDLVWHNVEDFVTRIEPTLGFWQGTAHLGLLHNDQPVSCNLTDSVLSFCNELPFAERLSHNFQHALRTELMLKYLSHDRLEKTLLGELQLELAPAPATE